MYDCFRYQIMIGSSIIFFFTVWYDGVRKKKNFNKSISQPPHYILAKMI